MIYSQTAEAVAAAGALGPAVSSTAARVHAPAFFQFLRPVDASVWFDDVRCSADVVDAFRRGPPPSMAPSIDGRRCALSSTRLRYARP